MTDDTLPADEPTPGAEAEVDGVALELAAAALDDDPPPPRDAGDVALLALIDRLATLLDRSDLSELEVESGGTALVLRKPVAAPAPAAAAKAVPTGAAAGSTSAGGGASASQEPGATSGRPSVKAPLTGIFYGSPTPGSAPYVKVGGDVAVGQIVGLIEAMKLFNEIKSDLAGRVVRVIPESGTLVKARQPLLEVDPL